MLHAAHMPPAERAELHPEATCRNCGQALPAGKSVCPACGAAHGEVNRCPHCHAVADVEAHAALGFRCLVCGGPRVALDVAGVTPSDRTLALLQQAGREHTKHMMFSAAGFMLAGMGALALFIGSVVVLSAAPGLVPAIATYFGAAVPVLAGLLSLSRAAGARKQRATALRTAQVSALSDVQAVTGVLDAQRAGELLRIGPERAELLLAEASVATLLEEAPAPRLRIDPALAEASVATLLEEAPAPRPRVDPATVLAETPEDAGEAAAEPRGKTARGDTEL